MWQHHRRRNEILNEEIFNLLISICAALRGINIFFNVFLSILTEDGDSQRQDKTVH